MLASNLIKEEYSRFSSNESGIPYSIYLLGVVVFSLSAFLIWNIYVFYRIDRSPPRPGGYACSPSGECVTYPQTDGEGNELCPIFFETKNCDNRCTNVSTHCIQ